MSDLIDRQMAIDVLNNLITGATESGFIWIYRDDAYKALEQLPSAQPEPSQVAKDIARIVENEQDMRILPKRGKWIYAEDSMADCVDGYRCDHCGFFVPWDYTHKSIDYIKSYNYCPYCGADMRGEQE